MTEEVKALIRWLNAYAFAGWLLTEHSEMTIEEMTRISEEENEEYQKLLEEFNQAKLEIVEKAGEENES